MIMCGGICLKTTLFFLIAYGAVVDYDFKAHSDKLPLITEYDSDDFRPEADPIL
jgi:hypothetical protein